MTSSHAALLISSIGASNSLGRLVSGWVCDQVIIVSNLHTVSTLLTSGVVTSPGHHHSRHHRGGPVPVPALSVSVFTSDLTLTLSLCSLSGFWPLIVTSSVFGLVTGLWMSAIPPALISLLGIRGNLTIISIIISNICVSHLRSGHGIRSSDAHKRRGSHEWAAPGWAGG